jgi:hypothetical protein
MKVAFLRVKGKALLLSWGKITFTSPQTLLLMVLVQEGQGGCASNTANMGSPRHLVLVCPHLGGPTSTPAVDPPETQLQAQGI